MLAVSNVISGDEVDWVGLAFNNDQEDRVAVRSHAARVNKMMTIADNQIDFFKASTPITGRRSCRFYHNKTGFFKYRNWTRPNFLFR